MTPLPDELSKYLQQLAQGIDVVLNGEAAQQPPGRLDDRRKNGFVLLVFPFEQVASRGGKSICNYIANTSNRKDIVALLKEITARFEGQPEMEGHA